MRHHPQRHSRPYSRPHHRPVSAPKRAAKGGAIATLITIVGFYGFFDDLMGIIDTAKNAVPAVSSFASHTLDAQTAIGNVVGFSPIQDFERTISADPTTATGKGYWPQENVYVQVRFEAPENIAHFTYISPDGDVIGQGEVNYDNEHDGTLEELMTRQLRGCRDAVASL